MLTFQNLRLANQNYDNYEIIVVNDNSTDKTKEVVEEFQLIYSTLKLVNVKMHFIKNLIDTFIYQISENKNWISSQNLIMKICVLQN